MYTLTARRDDTGEEDIRVISDQILGFPHADLVILELEEEGAWPEAFEAYLQEASDGELYMQDPDGNWVVVAEDH